MVKQCNRCGRQAEVATYFTEAFTGYPGNGARGVHPVSDLCVECAPPGAASPFNPEPNAMVQAARARAARRA